MFFGQRIKILVAPLDWGLGHATRCIPIIKQLLAKNCQVILAADGPQKALLQQEFPDIDFIQLPSYGISYSGKDFLNSIKIAAQLPKILSRIRQENQYLNGTLVRDKWDAVISDNRFGLYSTGLHSVFITHQLHIENPFVDWVSKFLSDWNYQFIERFNECWVPDLKEEPGIAGALSHPSQLPHIPIRYIGPLSRFEVLNQKAEQFDLLIILSGPEPQRSRFEKILLDQVGSYGGNVVLVRGLPGEKEIPAAGPNLSIYNHADAGELNQMIQSSRFVLARSGYSTIMDLLLMGKKAILIPTPGQSEQVYLARNLSERNIIIRAEQQDFDLVRIMKIAETFSFTEFKIPQTNLLESAIDDLLDRLSKSHE